MHGVAQRGAVSRRGRPTRCCARPAPARRHLACGPHEPMYPPAAEALKAAGVAPGRIHNNCSGKHAGMLALAQHHGWPLDGYHRAGPPCAAARPPDTRRLERRRGARPSSWPSTAAGCRPLRCRWIASPPPARVCCRGRRSATPRGRDRSRDDRASGVRRRHRTPVHGADGPPAARLFAKVGAEGYYCAGVPARRLGIALKVEDGARRASEPALLAVLRRSMASRQTGARLAARFCAPADAEHARRDGRRVRTCRADELRALRDSQARADSTRS